MSHVIAVKLSPKAWLRPEDPLPRGTLMWLLSGDFSSYKVGSPQSCPQHGSWLPPQWIIGERGRETDRQTDKHTKREATVSFYKFGSNLLSLLPYWSRRPTIDLLIIQTNSGTREEGSLKGSTRRQGSLRTSWVTGYHRTESIEVGETEFYWCCLSP